MIYLYRNEVFSSIIIMYTGIIYHLRQTIALAPLVQKLKHGAVHVEQDTLRAAIAWKQRASLVPSKAARTALNLAPSEGMEVVYVPF